MNNTNSIQNKVQHHYDTLVEKGYEVMAVMLYGSQNYNLDTPESDVDTKAIVIPSLDDLIDNKQTSKTISIADGQCDVKDIRLMFKNYEKQNVNYIETLFTDYYAVNPKWQEQFEELKQHRETIARLNENRAVNCMYGMIKSKYAHLTKDTPATHEDVTLYGYDRKNYYHMQRLLFLMKDYIDNLPYEKIISYNGRKRHQLLEMKTTPFKLDDVLENAQNIAKRAETLADNFNGTTHDFEFPAKEIIKNHIETSIWNIELLQVPCRKQERKDAMYNAIDIAKHIINKSLRDKSPITNSHLQKTLYAIQSDFLKNGKEAFSDDFFAWENGPVIPRVYYRFSGSGGAPIIIPQKEENLSETDIEIIDRITETLRAIPTQELSEKIKNNRKDNTIITKKEISEEEELTDYNIELDKLQKITSRNDEDYLDANPEKEDEIVL